MIEIQQLLQQVQKTSGSNDKKYLITKNANLLGLTDILQFIYNPYFRTGISENKAAAALLMSWQIPESKDMSYYDIMKYLKCFNTGSDADIYTIACFFRSNRDTEWLANAVVTQKLTIGLTSTSFNKIFGDSFIPKVGCMLGTDYKNVISIKWPCIVTEKLDGIRRLLIKEDGICRLYSRSGHEDTSLVDIMHEAQYLPDNYVYDGELLAMGTHKDNIALRQATSSLSSSKGAKTGLIYNIFDMVPLGEFYNTSNMGCRPSTAVVRKTILARTLGDPGIANLNIGHDDAFRIKHNLQYIKPVPILGVAKSIKEVAPIVHEIWGRGGEGVMLNTYDGLYEVKRSKHLIKVKYSEETTLPIIDFIEGKDSYAGMLGSFVVDYKGQRVGVGSGLTLQQREFIWDNQDRYIGKKIEIEHFGESTNAAGTVSLNCPIFKRIVGEE